MGHLVDDRLDLLNLQRNTASTEDEDELQHKLLGPLTPAEHPIPLLGYGLPEIVARAWASAKQDGDDHILGYSR